MEGGGAAAETIATEQVPVRVPSSALGSEGPEVLAEAIQESSRWAFTLSPTYHFERSLMKEVDYYRLEPTLTTPVGALGGRIDYGTGRARIVPRQQNVFATGPPLPWADGSLLTWNTWYGIQLPDDLAWDIGALVGCWGQDGETYNWGEFGSQRIHVRGPFLYGHAFARQPWGRGRGVELEATWSDLAIEAIPAEFTLEEDIRHIDTRLVGTVHSEPKFDVFGVLHRVQEDHSFTRTNVAPEDPLPRQWSFDAAEYRFGPGLRFRYRDDPSYSFSVAPLVVTGDNTAGYLYLTSDFASVVEDWNAAGEYSNLNLSGSFGLEMEWGTPAFDARLSWLHKRGQGDRTFTGPIVLPGIGASSGLFGFDQSLDDVFIKGSVGLKARDPAHPRWWEKVAIEPAYRSTRNRGEFTLDAPALGALGMGSRLQQTRTSFRSEIYYLGLSADEVWVFDRLYAGYGWDRVGSQDYGYFGAAIAF